MTKNPTEDFPKEATTTDDSKSAPKTRLEKLEQQRAKIAKQIALAKNREKAEERKLDTRRKVLIGAMVLYEAENDPALYDDINRRLDKYLLEERNRKLFPDIPPQHRQAIAEAKEKEQKKATA